MNDYTSPVQLASMCQSPFVYLVRIRLRFVHRELKVQSVERVSCRVNYDSSTKLIYFRPTFLKDFYSGMALSKQYPASISLDDIKRNCPIFGDKVCPFAKLVEVKKGVADNCPAFKSGCPYKNCQTIGEFEDKLGNMRDSHNSDKSKAASLQFLRVIHNTAKEKEADVGSACPFFQTKGGCPFAKDTSKKPILSPDYIVAPMGVTLNDTMFTCPAFGKGVCPYTVLVTKCKGLAGNCPAFKAGCPFKNCKSVGEFVEKLTQMRDQMQNSSKGKAAAAKFIQQVHAISESEEKKSGACPFNAHVCPFSHDAQGQPIIPK